MYTIVLFTLTVAVLGRTVSSQVVPPTAIGTFGACTDSGATKGDSSDCSIHYECTKGQWVREQCMSGFHFNKIRQSCDFSNHAGCKVGDPEQGVEPPTFGSCSGSGSKGDVSDCSIYYRCKSGNWVRNQCLSGFHWNRISQSCNFINTAGCTVGDPEQGKEPPTFGACTGYGTKGDSSNCTIHYSCKRGQWVRSQCMRGFHFNKIRQGCDFIDHADCTVGDPEQGQEPPETFGACTGFGTMTGDLKSCSIYYKCNREGQWKRNQCISGFQYNDVAKRCDFTSIVRCTKGL